jgi:uncharacterized DUF497 family protein
MQGRIRNPSCNINSSYEYRCIDKRHTCSYFINMTYNWNDEKNEILKKERNISFEEIVICISEGKVVAVLKQPNEEKYNNQKIYLINYNEYIYAVPFVENIEGNEIFLKTIYLSRDFTKKYLENGGIK